MLKQQLPKPTTCEVFGGVNNPTSARTPYNKNRSHISVEVGEGSGMAEDRAAIAQRRRDGGGGYNSCYDGTVIIAPRIGEAAPLLSMGSNSASARPPRNRPSQSSGSYSTPTGFSSIWLPWK